MYKSIITVLCIFILLFNMIIYKKILNNRNEEFRTWMVYNNLSLVTNNSQTVVNFNTTN